MFELRLQIGLYDQNLVRKKRTLISNLDLSNIINFQKQRNYGQLQYKEGLSVFEAWFCVFVLCTRCAVCIVQSAYLKIKALTKRTLISNPDLPNLNSFWKYRNSSLIQYKLGLCVFKTYFLGFYHLVELGLPLHFSPVYQTLSIWLGIQFRQRYTQIEDRRP